VFISDLCLPVWISQVTRVVELCLESAGLSIFAVATRTFLHEERIAIKIYRLSLIVKGK